MPYFSLMYLIIMSLVAAMQLLGLFDINPYEINLGGILEAPNFNFIAGTDNMGRDIFSRLVLGAQTSLGIAFSTTLIAGSLGVSLGILAAYFGGFIDFVIMRFIDFIYSLPSLLVLSIIAFIFDKSSISIIFGLAFINWMEVARITRSEFLKLQNEDFVNAAKLMSLSHFRIIFIHMLPNAMSLILATIGFTIPRAIIAETTLSFIGLGLNPPDTSWGTLAGDGFQYMRTNPHMIIFPALLTFLTCFSFNQLITYLSTRHRTESQGHLLQYV